MEFKKKAIFVTGADSILGKEIALAFAKANPKILIITGKNQNELSETEANCIKFCQNTKSIIGDMRKEEDIQSVVEFVERETKGSLDIFIGSHGSNIQSTAISEFDSNTFNEIMNINFTSMVHLTNLLARFMNEGSSIVFVTSTNDTKPAPLCSAYCSSKAALSMFMKCAAIDLGKRGIRVNSIASCLPSIDEIKDIGKSLPCGHAPSYQGAVNAIMFLSSDMAKDITGIEQVVDCGMSLL
ncbi:L-xylulose reductase-like [Histomonas meleagridis]|uniref:L-xylulose reductase-like n=1 Tax=Histomonas meleagridis TaxID=135588 RepID=UPI0035596BCB|nr:L-xylulose reductase-like [Histomonas meleagridis]KAH0804631.1 L-xylulose reductase-like [Histomonas meleagridis]